uniref:Uncharacterized protein n=1 Tax=Oryza meridionalis TaxID=40149 RepID=A0A0E0EG68_9ORYZ
MGEFRPVLLPLRLPSIVPRSNPVSIHADLEIAGAAALPLINWLDTLNRCWTADGLSIRGLPHPSITRKASTIFWSHVQNQDSSGGYYSWQSVARSACPSMKPHSTPSFVTRGKPYRALNSEFRYHCYSRSMNNLEGME